MANQSDDDNRILNDAMREFIDTSYRNSIASAFGIPQHVFDESTASNTPAPPLTADALRRMYAELVAPRRQIALMAMTEDSMIELEQAFPGDVTYSRDGKRIYFGGIQVILRDDVPAGKVIVLPRQEMPWLIQRPKINLIAY